MSALPQPRFSSLEYLAIERESEIRHQFYDGRMFAMSGASVERNRIARNLLVDLHNQLKGTPCEPFVNDMRVKVDASGLYTYPDVVVVCDKPEFEDEHVDTLFNPRLIIEVLSDSTESYDRGKRFEHYRQLESLTDYLLVSQTEPHIERFARTDDGAWLLTEATGLEAAIPLPTIASRLALGDVYAEVNLASN